MLPENNLEIEDVEFIIKNYNYALKLELVRTNYLTDLMQNDRPVLVYSAQ